MNTYPSSLGDIYLGRMQDGMAALIEQLQPSSLFLLTDSNTAKYCAPLVQTLVRTSQTIIIPAGEQHKTLTSCQHVWSSFIEQEADRSSMVLNVGGGLTCDLGGFASSCFQRGIRFGHIPTSLLAMADAAIGGKTGVNFEGYKNYLGRFEAPSFIWIDPVFLKTLPERELSDGVAEIIKQAIIGSRSMWDMLSGFETINSIDWTRVLGENLLIKKHIVEADPLEKGVRKVLNFGHTIGHALESYFLDSTTPISHGQAVTLGMLTESKIALELGLLDNEDFQGIIGLIHRLLGKVEVTLPTMGEIHKWLLGDKKKVNGKIGFSLPDRIGSCGWNIEVDNLTLDKSFRWLSTQVAAS